MESRLMQKCIFCSSMIRSASGVLLALQNCLQLMLGQHTLNIVNGYCLGICTIREGHDVIGVT